MDFARNQSLICRKASPPCFARTDRAARQRRSASPSADNSRSVEICSVKPNSVRLLSKAVQRFCVSASRGDRPVLAPDIFGCQCSSRRNIARDNRERLHRAFGVRHSTINRDGYSSSSSSKSRKFFCWRRSRCGLRAAASAARPSSSSDNRPGVFFRRSFSRPGPQTKKIRDRLIVQVTFSSHSDPRINKQRGCRTLLSKSIIC